MKSPFRSRSPGNPGKRFEFKKHLEGYELGLSVVIFAVCVAKLSIAPTEVHPELPMISVNQGELRSIELDDDARADNAEKRGMAPELRELGASLRTYGRADALSDTDRLREAKELVSTRARVARGRHGLDGLRDLRAYQLKLFLRTLRDAQPKNQDADATEVLGGFLNTAGNYGWKRKHGGLRMGDHELRAFFKKRWNTIVGVTDELPLSLNEERCFYRFLIENPVDTVLADTTSTGAAIRARRNSYRLKKVNELAQLDSSYLADLARGVIYYQDGRYLLSAESLRRHLEQHPDGPFALRARNYLFAALIHAQD